MAPTLAVDPTERYMLATCQSNMVSLFVLAMVLLGTLNTGITAYSKEQGQQQQRRRRRGGQRRWQRRRRRRRQQLQHNGPA